MTAKKQIREKFRTAVFARDEHRCRMCGWTPMSGDEGLDSHHISDRNLLPYGGYVASNGISLCADCHWKAEQFHISGVAVEGYSPNDLYATIGSSYDKAFSDCKKIPCQINISMSIPSHLVESFKIINDAREAAGLKPFAWHDKLYQMAQELADWGWDAYINKKADISADPHHDAEGRFDRAGWVKTDETGLLLPAPPPGGMPGKSNSNECGIGGDSDGLGEDGKAYPPDPSGWCHPFTSPETQAKSIVYDLTIGITDPNEGHRWDFHAGYTHAALGYQGGIMIVDYGYLPNEPAPDPNELNESDFDMGGD